MFTAAFTHFVSLKNWRFGILKIGGLLLFKIVILNSLKIGIP